MGQGEYLSPNAWGRLLSNLLEHDLATLLSQVDVKTLSEAQARTVLYEQLRSFMRLKSTLKSSEPGFDVLRPAHEALLNFAARLFIAAHQALLNDGQTDSPHKPAFRFSWRAKRQHEAVVPTKRFLLEWQLVRLKVARERLIMELADLSEREVPLFEGLGLPDAVSAEVESARLRVSGVWKKIPRTASMSNLTPEAGKFADGSS